MVVRLRVGGRSIARCHDIIVAHERLVAVATMNTIVAARAACLPRRPPGSTGAGLVCCRQPFRATFNTKRAALGLAPSLLASGPDRSRNHPAVCQLEFAAQAIGVASHGRTKSPLGSPDFDTSAEREGKGGATDKGPIRCRPLEADVAVARAWFFPPVVFE